MNERVGPAGPSAASVLSRARLAALTDGEVPALLRTAGDAHPGLALPRALVIQTGARRGYVVPRMLEEAGMLESFHTTAARHEARGDAVFALARRILPHKADAFDRRTVRGIQARRLFAHPSADLARFLVRRNTGDRVAARRAMSTVLGWAMAPAVRETHANIVLSVDGSGGPALLRALKAKGLPIVVDIATTPRALEITDAARTAWPDWADEAPSPAERAGFLAWYETIVGLADLVLYPSAPVLDGLQTLAAFDIARARHVPYTWGRPVVAAPDPIPGRILFAGSGALRKGLPVLAEATHILRAAGHAVDVVVAGALSPPIRARAAASGLTPLGHLGPDAMAAEMAKADLFTLPSLAEGTAAVVLEALATGVPAIVTRAAGAPVVHGESGLIVPERNPAALAGAIAALLTDRPRRDRMAAAARESRAGFAPAAVKDRLVAALATALREQRR
ncbi:glycosyltransferase family 4 protein [Acuticoccus kandeliae]|uniref:glycosyltransferase family 4 protein n=1 Tax=Acuticoccus kandeliae TaxID=2073160 RepID=UPI000D3EA841|nr:glycosyltransferase family 4 protein [Acuticoccus kandeliae]